MDSAWITCNNSREPRPLFSEDSNSKNGFFNERPWKNNADHLREGEWTREGPFSRERQNFHREDGKSFREEQKPAEPIRQAALFQTYNYDGADRTYCFGSSRRPLSTPMSYNMTAPWNANPVDGMAMNESNNINQSSTVMQMTTSMSAGLEMVPTSGSGAISYAFKMMPSENIYDVVGMGNYCQYNTQESMYFPQVKEVVTFSKGVLYPPDPTVPRPTTKEKPLGCKTIFVSGLPKTATEEIIREIFEKCGTVESIRMSKENFCHIRFSSEMHVELAIYFSGYRLKVESKDEPLFSGRLEVDYVHTRDDQFDYECKQRSLQRQTRHQEQSYYRPVVCYTDKEASVIREKLKTEETFPQAAGILITWLERGECTKKNAGNFYSMIQSTHNHVRKLQIDKVKYKEQFNDAKKMLKKRLEEITHQFTEIKKIYKAASLQKCWDHFTKAQRKNIDIFKKQTEELKKAHVEEVLNVREDVEMELSDDDSEENKKAFDDSEENKKADDEQIKNQLKEDIMNLKEECDFLRSQLKHAQSEISGMKRDHQDVVKQKDDEIATLKQALQNGSAKRELMNLYQKVELNELHPFKFRKSDDKVNHSSNDSRFRTKY